jgi:DNA polymerase III delta prime subunit
MNRQQYLRQLRQAIAERFDRAELETLVFDLNVDWDELAGDTKSRKTLSFLIHLAQANRLADLLTLLRTERPQHQWPELPIDLPLFTPQPLIQEGRVRQTLLQKVRTFWVEGVLEQSLYGVARLELGLAHDPDAVERPWMMALERPSTSTTAIPPSTPIIDIFQQLNDSLLILGEPGSGKTTLLLELARELLDIAELDNSQPIPVIVNLASWAQEQKPLAEWLIDELNLVYQVNKKYGRQWLPREPFHLLLDGLDEVQAEQRPACVQAINQFRQEYGLTKIVVCSRTADYHSLTTQLQLLNALVIQPLTTAQVHDYLAGVGELTAVQQAITQNPELQELTHSPLILSILSLAYQDQTEIHSNQQLFTTYLQRMFARRRAPADYQQQALHWLKWLAQHFKHHSQTIFYLDNLQPTALTATRQKMSYQVFTRLIFGLITVVIYGLPMSVMLSHVSRTPATVPVRDLLQNFNSIEIGIYSGLIIGVLTAIFPGFAGIKIDQITHLEALSWVRPQKAHLIFGLRVGLGFGLIVTPFLWGISRTLPLALITGMLFFLLGGIIMIFTANLLNKNSHYPPWLRHFIPRHIYQARGGFHNVPITHITHPLQRVRSSLKNALYLGLMGAGLLFLTGLMIGLIVWILDGAAFGQTNFVYQNFAAELQNKLAAGLLYGLLIGLSFGWIVGWTMALRPLTAVIQHYILRFILTRTNCIPSQTIPFLDEMIAHLILRRVGGGYIFVHRMLQDHLAET